MTPITKYIGASLIATERLEQINKHKRTVQDDILHNDGGVLLNAVLFILTNDRGYYPPTWSREFMAKIEEKDEIGQLKIAGALIAAEIDRLHNIKLQDGKSE